MLRIGELARRTGVDPDLLRAWERRYGLLTPARSAGGYRLYSEADETRVRAMLAELERGAAAAEAARLVLAEPETDRPAREELLTALLAFDEPRAQALLDRQLAVFTSETVVSALVLPLLAEVGERWHAGEATIAQEHFATALLRGRLLGLARGWGGGAGPLALLACPEGERHDAGLLAFGLALRARGWRIVYLGADLPLADAAREAERLRPAAVVLALTVPGRSGIRDGLRALAEVSRVAIGGRGADAELAAAAGALLLPADPAEAADALVAA